MNGQPKNTMAYSALRWRGDGDGWVVVPRWSQSRFVIVTSAADGELAEIHHRQPLVLVPGMRRIGLTGLPIRLRYAKLRLPVVLIGTACRPMWAM